MSNIDCMQVKKNAFLSMLIELIHWPKKKIVQIVRRTNYKIRREQGQHSLIHTQVYILRIRSQFFFFFCIFF